VLSERIRQKRLLFVTKLGMMKLVDTSEFDVMKKTVASTKLTDGDELIGIYETDARTEVLSKFNYDGTVGEEEVVSSDQNIILQTAKRCVFEIPAYRCSSEERKNSSRCAWHKTWQ